MSGLRLRVRGSAVGAVATVGALLGLGVVAPAPVGAAANPFPHIVRGGFPTPTGAGFSLVFADGAVDNFGDAPAVGDASALPLQRPLWGGSGVAGGGGYWLVAGGRGVFLYGRDRFFRRMGGVQLEQPPLSMASD